MIAYFFIALLFFSGLHAQSIQVQQHQSNEHHYEVDIHVDLQPNQWLYKDFLQFYVDHPTAVIQSTQASYDPLLQYDPAFKATKKIYNKPVTFHVVLDNQGPEGFHDTNLHMYYQLNTQTHPEHMVIPLNNQQPQDKAVDQKSDNDMHHPATDHQHQPKEEEKKSDKTRLNADYIEKLLERAQSLWLRLLLVFLLGILFSLTPCIYPMIPITIGILQSHAKRSLVKNFLHALLYTAGMAMTYALFGLLASCVGPLCGKLLVNPIFIVGLVIVLIYLACSMFGFYELYIPRALQQNYQPKKGSIFSIFLWGVASGTFASPCVSPGLALVLTIVATIGNKFIGFLILFFFGIGLSIPLLVIGTFSSSLHLLPQAGLWMIEVKRLLGFMILAMAFYYLNYIIALQWLLFIIAVTMIGLGIFYALLSINTVSKRWKYIHQLMSILLIAGAFPVAYYGYRESLKKELSKEDFWHTQWQDAVQQAQREHKRIFIDFWASFCSVCVSINKTVLADITMQDQLAHYVLLKVDGTHESNRPYQQLKEKFAITGFPVFIIYDVTADKVLKRWGSEISTMDRKELIEELCRYESPDVDKPCA